MRALLLDLGGVVIPIDPGRCHRCWAAVSPLGPDEVAARVYPDGRNEALERGDITAAAYLAFLREQLETEAGDEQLRDCFNRVFVGLDRDVLGLARTYAEAGWCLLALTNANVMHERAWSQRWAAELAVFERIHTSFELRARKPERDAFEQVLTAEGLAPGRVVFADDTPANVTAARRLGIHGIVFEGAADLRRRLPPPDGHPRPSVR